MMSGQLSLSFGDSIAERFEIFHRDNPQVYDTLLRLAREWTRQTGGRKLGISALFERARWDLALATSDPDFKLNNSYRAYYARLLMHENPDLRGLFDLRVSAADDWLQTLGRTA